MLKQGNVIVFDSIRNLINSIPRRSVRLRLSPDTLPSALRPLMINEQSREGCYILALTEYPQPENVMAALRVAQAQGLELKVLQPDLKEVFVKITGNARHPESISV